MTGPVVEPPLTGNVLTGGGLLITPLTVPVAVGAGNVPVAVGPLAPLVTAPGEPAITTGLGVKSPPVPPETALIGAVPEDGLVVAGLAVLLAEPLVSPAPPPQADIKIDRTVNSLVMFFNTVMIRHK